VRWFAFALNASFTNTPSLLTSETHTDTSSVAQFTFTGASQHGRLAFQTSGSYVPGAVDLEAFDFLNISAAVTGGAVSGVQLHLSNGDNIGCQWNTTTAVGPDYSFDLWDPDSCFNDSAAAPDFSLSAVSSIQIGILSSGAGSRTLSVTAISMVPN
jgi:hypothetical protein